jgi:hypothetical protein
MFLLGRQLRENYRTFSVLKMKHSIVRSLLERQPQKNYQLFAVLKTRHRAVQNTYTAACLGKTGKQEMFLLERQT